MNGKAVIGIALIVAVVLYVLFSAETADHKRDCQQHGGTYQKHGRDEQCTIGGQVIRTY